jgi:hypothetical protein
LFVVTAWDVRIVYLGCCDSMGISGIYEYVGWCGTC